MAIATDEASYNFFRDRNVRNLMSGFERDRAGVIIVFFFFFEEKVDKVAGDAAERDS